MPGFRVYYIMITIMISNINIVIITTIMIIIIVIVIGLLEVWGLESRISRVACAGAMGPCTLFRA